jgi:hypothetical protein
MEKFKAIAMKCNQEQFEAIKPKLINNIKEMSGFKVCNYLTNNLGGKEMIVSNIHYADKERKNRTVYETWNEETFLRACGIEVDEPLTVSKEFPQLFEPKPIKMTVAEVEAKLGHPVEIVK